MSYPECKSLALLLYMEKDLLFEKLAAIEHERWSDWQKYVHSNCQRSLDGASIIPLEFVEQWERQINTPYSDLSEKEKDSDREQVKRYWDLINTIPRARAIMREAFESDEGFKLGYICNIAVILLDNLGTTKEARDKVAEKILKRIFE